MFRLIMRLLLTVLVSRLYDNIIVCIFITNSNICFYINTLNFLLFLIIIFCFRTTTSHQRLFSWGIYKISLLYWFYKDVKVFRTLLNTDGISSLYVCGVIKVFMEFKFWYYGIQKWWDLQKWNKERTMFSQMLWTGRSLNLYLFISIFVIVINIASLNRSD